MTEDDSPCPSCERCTWNPGPDCGKPDHPHCPICGHCTYRHKEQTTATGLARVRTPDRASELQAAISEADEESFTSLEEAASAELSRLWNDLHVAIGRAHGGCWSVECENTAYRIACLTRALGRATPWGEIQLELLESGIYQRMHDLMGVSYEQPDMAVVAQMRADRDASVARWRAEGARNPQVALP